MWKFHIKRHELESPHRMNVELNVHSLCGLSNACRLMRNFHIHSKIFFESVGTLSRVIPNLMFPVRKKYTLFSTNGRQIAPFLSC